MSHPFFRPQEVHAEALLLIGYKLYPCARIELHPRLTLLAGSNGVGKTTLLDTLQTILIADQRYIHLNVAAGQNDRDLGGQLQGRVAWALLHLRGHSSISAIGVHVLRRAAAEYVDLKPFALIGALPDQDLFLNPLTCVVAPDIKALNAAVKARSAQARVKEFSSLNEYHRFLFEEGLLPLDLSRGGRRQFSLLWRQATQPHLGELNSFLQKTLCHEPEKRLTFDDVEKLMQERLHTERQLTRLAELKELNAELQAKADELDRHRRRCLGMGLGQAKQREESIRAEIEEGEQKFKQFDERMQALNEELDAVRARLAEIGMDRDKYLREQGEWSRKYKHHQEYVAHRRLLEDLEDELAWSREDVFPMEARLDENRRRIEALREEMRDLSNELARCKEKEAGLERQAKKWRDFKKDLERVEQLLEKEIRSASDLKEAWLQVAEERREIQEAKPLRQLLGQWESRARAHAAAAELARIMVELWPDFFGQMEIDRSSLDAAQNMLRSMEKEITLGKEALRKQKKPLNELIEELSRGRLPLPASAAELVEKGVALPFTNRFDTLSLDEAKKRQDSIGPFSRAIEPTGETEDEAEEGEGNEDRRLSGLARGKEPFLLVLSPDVWEKFQILEEGEDGVIAAYGGVGWYTPKETVWIGAEARREQTKRAQDKLLQIDERLKELSNEEDLISKRLKAIQNFLPKLDAFSDSQASAKTSELKEKLKEIESKAPGVERLYPMLEKLFQKSELFNFVEAPEQMEQLNEEILELEDRYIEMEESLKGLKAENAGLAKEHAALHEKVQDLGRNLARIQTVLARLEDEETDEVLRGEVDFGRAEELQTRINELDEERKEVQNSLFSGERKFGELRNRYRSQSESLARMKADLERAQKDHARAIELWSEHYSEEEPNYLEGGRFSEREHHKVAWESLVQSLKSRLAEVSAKYDLRLPEETQPDRLAPQLLQLLLPPGIALDHLEQQFLRLQHELQQIEYKIKSHVEEVRSGVEGEIRRLKLHLVRVNRILSALRFGKIKRIYLEIEELPAYQAMKKLESVLRLISRQEVVTLKEFIEKLRAFILKEANTTLSEEQIADYRSYIRIRRVIVDAEDRMREGGLSSGETLGVNFALCLSILFFLGREQSVNERGMLLLALDEAERLDARALGTVRDLLDHVRCQLTVAMPRPVDIPDSICHLLTPLSQGVTHVHLYHKGEMGDM